jgi:UDP-2,4-diacetamido-2,4,6-trideoxy-beta-L-altropyranose hydrolase
MAAAPALIVRADGGPDIGGGHVMRCLALAQAWSAAGGRVGFCSALLAPSLRQRLASESFGVVEIAAVAGSAGDADATVVAAAAVGASAVVVDGYHLPADYRRRLRQAGLKVAVLDDNGGSGGYPDDLVINQNRHAAPELYRDRASHTRLLLGTDYALLRREFRNWRGPSRSFPATPRQVLVTLGAADPDNVTGDVMACLGSALSAATEVVVLVGGSNPHGDAIGALAQRLPACRLIHGAAGEIPDLMAAADLAVCAGGSTMWEMAGMGVPFIPVVIADNQRAAVQAMARDGYPTVDSETVGRDLSGIVTALAANSDRRRELSRTGRRLVDGKGVERVCDALRHLYNPAVA